MKAEDEDKALETGELALGETDGPQIVVASPVGPNAQPTPPSVSIYAYLSCFVNRTEPFRSY